MVCRIRAVNKLLWMLPVVAMFGAGCASDPSTGTGEPRTLHVMAGESIQDAVDDAKPGDMVLVAPGVYTDPVVVMTPGIVLRGEDRNTVILDGQYKSASGVSVFADGVAVENMTVADWIANGVFFSGSSSAGDVTQLDGFAVRYVTANNNGLYGIYAFQSGNGTIADSYVSGHPDSGVYVGQCRPCNVTVEGVTAEYNAVGYEGTNSSGVYVINSVFRNNRIGITPNSQNMETMAPQGQSTIVGNLVIDNDDPQAPEQASGGFAIGIAVGGGVSNVVSRNRVEGHDGAGILVTTLDGYIPANNQVTGNVLADNTVDLGFWIDGGMTETEGNGFALNTYKTSSPADIESLPVVVDAPVPVMPPSPAGPSYQDAPRPGPQPTMSRAQVSGWLTGWVWVAPEVTAIQVPDR